MARSPIRSLLLIFGGLVLAKDTHCAVFKLSVYFESLCPYSPLISEQIYPELLKFGGVANRYLSLDLVPYGKCNTSMESNGNLEFTCRRGNRGIDSYKLHVCALGKYSLEKALPFITCLITNRTEPDVETNCAKLTDIDFSKIQNCAQSLEGNVLMARMGIRNRALNQRPKSYPWLLFSDGLGQTGYDSDDAEDFLGLVCKKLAAKGVEIPAQCLGKIKLY